MPTWLVTLIIGILTVGGGILGAVLTFRAMSSKVSQERDAANQSAQLQLVNSAMAFTDRKDAEIKRLTDEGNAQASRITSLELANKVKDERIATLTQENYDLQRQIAKVNARMEFLEDIVTDLRALIKQGRLGGGREPGAVMGLAVAPLYPPPPQKDSAAPSGGSEDAATHVHPVTDEPEEIVEEEHRTTHRRRIPKPPTDDTGTEGGH